MLLSEMSKIKGQNSVYRMLPLGQETKTKNKYLDLLQLVEAEVERSVMVNRDRGGRKTSQYLSIYIILIFEPYDYLIETILTFF